MATAFAEYAGVEISSDGQTHLKFHVSITDPDALSSGTVDVDVTIPGGVTDVNPFIRDAVRKAAADDGFTLGTGDLLVTGFIKM